MNPNLSKSKFNLSDTTTKGNHIVSPLNNRSSGTSFDSVPIIDKNNLLNVSTFIKKVTSEEEDIDGILRKNEPNILPKKDINEEFSQKILTKYLLNWDEAKHKKEEDRLRNWKYGPSILIARSLKDYYKIVSLRKYAIFKLSKIKEIESRYTLEDKYFESVRDIKNELENMNEKNIRGLLKFFYFEK